MCLYILLQNNVGVLAMLDEECLRPGTVTDLTFLAKLDSICSEHPHYESRGCKKSMSDRTLPHESFRLKHYAGAVSDLAFITDFSFPSSLYNSCFFSSHFIFNLLLLLLLFNTLKSLQIHQRNKDIQACPFFA